MHQALTQATKADAIGLYFLEPQRLSLQWSLGAPNGFLESWSSELGVKDPLLMATLHEGRPLSGHTLYDRATLRRILGTWGFASNMCGLLQVNQTPAAVVFAASHCPTTFTQSESLEWMELFCRAGSLALRQLLYPRAPISQNIQDASIESLEKTLAKPISSCINELPKRLQQVAAELCMGHSNKEIARNLGISDETVKDHVRRLCERFNARNRTQLVAKLSLASARINRSQKDQFQAGSLLSYVSWW